MFDNTPQRSKSNSVKWDLYNEPEILPFWLADMDFQSPPSVKKSLQEVINHNLYGYPLIDEDYYSIVSNWHKKRYSLDISKEMISSSPGIGTALSLLIESFTKQNDEIIIQPPVYYSFYNIITGQKRIPLFNPLKLDTNGYHMDLDHLESIITPRTKMLILCSPHNPVGRVWKKSELSALAAITQKYNILVIADEIHCDLIMPKSTFTSFASLSESTMHSSITCTSPSKTFNLSGLHNSTVIIANPKMHSQFNSSLHTHGIYGPSRFAIVATKAVYSYEQKWLTNLITYIHNNYLFLKEYLSTFSTSISIHNLEGTYLSWLDFRNTKFSNEEWNTIFLNKAKVRLSDGKTFGPGGDGFFRMNIACPRLTLKNGLDRISSSLKNCL